MILPNSPTMGKIAVWSIFKWSTTGLNSYFSFFYAGFLTKTREPSMPHYLPIVVRRSGGFMSFQEYSCEVKFKQLHPGFELGLSIPFPIRIIVMLCTKSIVGLLMCSVSHDRTDGTWKVSSYTSCVDTDHALRKGQAWWMDKHRISFSLTTKDSL